MPARTSKLLASVFAAVCAALALNAAPAHAQAPSSSVEVHSAVQSEAASIIVSGTLERAFGPEECFVLRAGFRTYGLIGRIPRAYVGRDVIVRGELLTGATPCMQGTPLRVLTITLA